MPYYIKKLLYKLKQFPIKNPSDVFYSSKEYLLYENDLKKLKPLSEISILINENDIFEFKMMESDNDFKDLLIDGYTFSNYLMTNPECEKRLRKGALMFCAFVNRELAHATWAGTKKGTYEDFFPFSLDYDDALYVGGTMTIFKFRRKKIASYAHQNILNYALKLKFNRVIFLVNKENIISQNFQKSIGSIPTGLAVQSRILLFIFRFIKS